MLHIKLNKTAFLAMTCAAVMTFSTADCAEFVRLKADVTIKGDVVTVGDLFENAGEYNNHALAPAPRIGSPLVLSNYDLKRISKAFNLNWVPLDHNARVVVTSAATKVENSKIAQEIEHAVKSASSSKDFSMLDVEIETPLPRLTIAGFSQPEIRVSNVKIDHQSDTFKTQLAIYSEGNLIEELSVNGRISKMMDIPVPAETLKNGDIITKNDISYIRIAESRLNESVALSAEDLIGMTPRRTLVSDRIVRMSDLEKPQIVKKGELITMVLQNGILNLTVKGKALESGAKGETIRILNTSSNRTIDATITGPQRVEISATTHTL